MSIACGIGRPPLRDAWATLRVLVAVLPRALAMLLVAIAFTPTCFADEATAKLVYSRGPISANASGGALRILGLASPLVAGDIIATGEESFAIIELPDHARVLLRPDTTLRLVAIAATGTTLNLERGGVRTQHAKDAAATRLQLVSTEASVTSTGGDFAARKCNVDCATERPGLKRVASPEPDTVARVMIAVGNVGVVDTAGHARSVVRGAALGVGDVINTGVQSHAVVAFRDSTRVTVQPDSAFKVEAYQLSAAKPDSESALFRLQHGGMRVATGDIAHRKQTNMRFATPVATIGIRGTGFDVVEATECGGVKAPPRKPGILASVWLGAVELAESKTLVNKGETVCQLEVDSPVYKVSGKPKLTTPRPDEVAIPADTFSSIEENGTEAGLHLSALNGDLTVVNNGGQVFLGAGDDGFAAGGGPQRAIGSLSINRADPFATLDLGGDAGALDAFQPQFGVMCVAGG